MDWSTALKSRSTTTKTSSKPLILHRQNETWQEKVTANRLANHSTRLQYWIELNAKTQSIQSTKSSRAWQRIQSGGPNWIELIGNIGALILYRNILKFICSDALNLIFLSVPHQKKFIWVSLVIYTIIIAAKVLAGRVLLPDSPINNINLN